MTQETVAIPRSLDNADSLEEILCLATLIAVEEFPSNYTIGDALHFFTEETESDCEKCPYVNRCLATIINQ